VSPFLLSSCSFPPLSLSHLRFSVQARHHICKETHAIQQQSSMALSAFTI
jgi:hypothetical protein